MNGDTQASLLAEQQGGVLRDSVVQVLPIPPEHTFAIGVGLRAEIPVFK